MWALSQTGASGVESGRRRVESNATQRLNDPQQDRHVKHGKRQRRHDARDSCRSPITAAITISTFTWHTQTPTLKL
ncbi:hypothetical protein SNOG_06821 [Parastagonospora nodorum SN15]|uniref:Uncharacterized protein n=1 Tax=Phaeosphaeria nodorum (strain SN15 / ATCC MYA-4574 / FGSC 10173) TaxID=321614 RepID=Q0UN43_PHANO|nr:hypothetical protein SNOG_06821 [Parastagonospora nodorum SN15]EAT85472.1 hypothetical protein SNOG_06821 [Parastagonospora nodorum SN15]